MLGGFVLHLLIFRHLRAGLRRDLKIGDPIAEARVGAQETRESLHALLDAFRAVKAVDANYKIPVPQARPHTTDDRVAFSKCSGVTKRRRVDCNRKSPHCDSAAVHLECAGAERPADPFPPET